uniref:Uncharacterized protein n=1 Tax=Lepeophtheirus salmonis TaxID=72036 RepID=A0A0K2TJI3_LEPSM
MEFKFLLYSRALISLSSFSSSKFFKTFDKRFD